MLLFVIFRSVRKKLQLTPYGIQWYSMISDGLRWFKASKPISWWMGWDGMYLRMVLGIEHLTMLKCRKRNNRKYKLFQSSLMNFFFNSIDLLIWNPTKIKWLKGVIEWNRKNAVVCSPNLDVGEGHETLDINWEWGAYQVRLDDYFEPGGKRENNKQHQSYCIPPFQLLFCW